MTGKRGGPTGRPALELLDPYGPRVAEIWRALEREAAPLYFLSWSWICNWLACLPRGEAPPLAVLRLDDRLVAAFFLGRRRLVRHGLLPSRTLFLNVTGEKRWDDLTVEHNGVLCARAARLSLATFVDALPGDWDELSLPALSRATFPGSALDEPLTRHVVRIDRESPSPFIDLKAVRSCPGGYLELVSSGTRAQIRRAERGFGDVHLEQAAGLREAFEVYDELVELHTRAWRSRCLPGAFADPWFDGFHRRLIGERFSHGEIQLLRLRSGGATLGCLYNLVLAGRVLFYQGGFRTFDDPRLKVGYLCHAEAVRHNAAAGHAIYDLLGGASRYKRSLATGEVSLVWARIQRPLARFHVEERLRRWKRALRG
jgi:hypothetical protein